MISSQQPMDDAGRKRHLEALFADEPFLSPTMKARRMHEKMHEARAREGAGGDRSSVVFGQDSGRAHALLEEPDFLRADRPASLQQRLTLAEAAARLRRPLDTGGFPGALPDALGQFKSQVLAQWVQRAGPRETAAAGAASGQDSLAARAVGRITDEFQR